MTKIEQLQKFITDNGLQFTEGRRNSDLVVLCGYALYTGSELGDLKRAIDDEVYTDELAQEIERVWDYTEANHYGLWWELESNRNQYKL